MASPQKENGHTEIANEILHALALAKLNGSQYKLIFIILRKTFGWQKKEDFISLSQFEKYTGLPRNLISRELIKLKKKNIIKSQNSPGKTKLYSLQKDYEQWYPPISGQLIKELTGLNKSKTINQTVDSKVKNNKPTINQTVDKCPPISRQTINQTVDELSTNQWNTKEIKKLTKETITKESNNFPFLSTPNFINTFQDYLEMRKKIRKPATERAKELALKELHKHDIKTAIAMLEQSIFNSWQGIFPLRKEQKYGKDKRYIPESLRENQEERRKQLEQGITVIGDD